MPPGFCGSSSPIAWTASSWSLASAGSIVTRGRARQSSRWLIVAAPAAFASSRTTLGKTCGIEWAWRAMVEIAFSEAIEPTIVTMRAEGGPIRLRSPGSTSTRSPSFAPFSSPAGIAYSGCLRSTGSMRPPPPFIARNTPMAMPRRFSRMRITRAMRSPSSPSSTWARMRSPSPAAGPLPAAWRTKRHGRSPFAAISQATGSAIRPPSSSRPRISSTAIAGRTPGA